MKPYPPYNVPFQPSNNIYIEQVKLLLEILPELNQIECFALKGGTAINLFFRDMPRLSVDIDLTYLPVAGRTESLAEARQRIPRRAGQREQPSRRELHHHAGCARERGADQDRGHARAARLCVRGRGA